MDIDESTKSEIKSDSVPNKLVRSALSRMLIVLGGFVFGGLLIFIALYNPARHKLEIANADLQQANETISTQSDRITTLQTENETLQTDLASKTLHTDMLKALSGLRGASLAVADDDYAGARLSLMQASEALDSLSGRLGVDQQDVFLALQQSASQALADLQNNLRSAQLQLDQLIKNLVQLEDNLFPNP